MQRGVRLHRLGLISVGLAVLAGLLVFLAFACSGKVTQAGGLELIVTTDLKTPDVFDTLRVEIGQESAPGTFHTWVAGDYQIPSETTLPTTVSIAAGNGPDQDALIRLTARKGTTPVVLREVQLQVPKDRVAELKLVISSMCYGKLTVDAKGNAQTVCSDPAQSCQPETGSCGPTETSTAQLPTYSPEDVPSSDAGPLIVVEPTTGAQEAGGRGEAGPDSSDAGSSTAQPDSTSSDAPGDVTDGGGSSDGSVTTTALGPRIPDASGACPTLATGTVSVLGQSVSLWVGTPQATPAPILFYWHGTGSNAAEAQSFMGPQINEIVGQGGLVASFSTSTGQGQNTGPSVWYTGDFAMVDQILACAVQQLNIDARQIYTAGCSAGGLQAGAMAYSRSSYLAASMPNSGGIVSTIFNLDDPSHTPSLITTHGGSSDMVVLSFAQTSATEDNDIAAKGGYVVDCDHDGGHCGAPASVIAAQWQFCKDHPFGVTSDPYEGGLPPTFPSYCRVVP